MKHRRGPSAVATTIVGALLLAACTTQSPPPTPGPSDPSSASTVPAEVPVDPCQKAEPGADAPAGGEISYSAGEGGFTSFNAQVRGADTPANEAVVDRLLGSFWYWGADGEICGDPDFGTYAVTSTDPLQVTYTIADDAVWSDGVPVTAADFLLDWAAQAITADGTVVGSMADGATGLFDHVAGLTLGDEVPAGPQAASADARELTYDYERAYAGWESLVRAPLPAHVVAAQVGVTVEELVTAIRDLDLTVLAPAAEFWNTGWTVQPGVPADPALTPSSGPYVPAEASDAADADTAEPGVTTLTANDAYGGTPPATRDLTFRSVATDTLVRSVQDGTLDVVQPQATVENLTQLEQAGAAVTVSTGPTSTGEHLDFNVRQGVFAGSLEAREAFAYCVPRQQIVDDLVRPVDPDAVVMDARDIYPFQHEYDDVVRAAYDGRYDDLDLDLAAEKFAAAGLAPGTQVRISYPAPNQRRAEQVALIKASCDQVGFDVVDAGDPDFYRSVLYPGAHDVALFGWVGSTEVVSGASISGSGGAQNYGGYSDAIVDEAWQTLLSTTDEAEQIAQRKIIEKQLWDTLFSIPLFAHPGLDAHRSDVTGVRSTVTRSGVTWSAEGWARIP